MKKSEFMRKWLEIERERIGDDPVTITIPYIQHLEEHLKLVEIGDIELDAEPSLCESNNQQTNQTVEQERGDISTLAPIIAQGVGKVKTVDEPSDESRAPVKDDAVSRIDEGSLDICKNCGLFELNKFGNCMHCGFHNEMKFDLKKSKSEVCDEIEHLQSKYAMDEAFSKESKIADELNKDYPNIKDYTNEDPEDFCKKCGTILIYSKQEKVFICPKCMKTKQSELNKSGGKNGKKTIL